MELFKLLGSIAIDNSQANKALADTAKKAGTSSNEVELAVNKIGSVAAGIAKGIGIAGVAIGGAWLAAIEGSREYRNEMGLLDSAFLASGHSSETAKQTYSDLNAVLGDTQQAVEASQHLAMIADNEKEMNELTAIGTGVFQRFGQSLPLEGMYEGILHTSQLGEVQGSLADALEWSGITVEDFNKQLAECSNAEERQDLIMKTLKDTYGEAAEQYKETNKDVMEARKAQEKLTDAFAELGRIGEPILTAIKAKVAEMVAAAVPHLESFIEKVQDAKKWIQENKDTVDTWVAVIIGASVAIGTFLLILNWGTIMTAAANALKTVRLAVLAFNTALSANPIGLVVSLIAGLVAAFIYLWNTNEGFRKFWVDLWEKVKSAAGTAASWIGNKFDDLKGAVSKVRDTFNNIQKTISEKMESARKKVSEIIDKIKGFFPLSLGKIFDNIKIPKISVSGGKAPYGIAGKGKMPSFDVKWNAEGGILTKPTIFGMTGNTFLGGGEAGAEAIAPITLLQDYIAAAVRKDNEALGKIIIDQNRLLLDFLSSNMPGAVRLDSGALVGALVPGIDTQLSERWSHSRRGNTR